MSGYKCKFSWITIIDLRLHKKADVELFLGLQIHLPNNVSDQFYFARYRNIYTFLIKKRAMLT